MKVKEFIPIGNKYNFEAPIFSAKTKLKIKEAITEKDGLFDLNKMLITDPQNMFIVRVGGESMIDKNIFDGDLLLVDTKKNPKEGDIVVSSLNGEMTVKTFKVENGKGYLISANQKFLPIEIGDFYQFKIQGVVKHVIRDL